jgi:hypothetical protein
MHGQTNIKFTVYSIWIRSVFLAYIRCINVLRSNGCNFILWRICMYNTFNKMFHPAIRPSWGWSPWRWSDYWPKHVDAVIINKKIHHNIEVHLLVVKILIDKSTVLYCVWNVMAHAQKPDFIFRRNGRVHLNRRGGQFSRLQAAEACASAVVMLDTPCSEVVWRVLATHSTRQFPLHFPSHVSPCAVTFQLDSAPYLFKLHGTDSKPPDILSVAGTGEVLGTCTRVIHWLKAVTLSCTDVVTSRCLTYLTDSHANHQNPQVLQLSLYLFSLP